MDDDILSAPLPMVADVELQLTPRDSSALTRSAGGGYPAEFQGRVPWRVRLTRTVRPLPMHGRSIAGYEGEEFDVWVSRHGVVALILGDGKLLGVKPGQFEVIEWHKRQQEGTQC